MVHFLLGCASGYTITMEGDADRCGLAGEDKAFSCIASYPDSLSTAPTISWYKFVSGGDDTLISVSRTAVRVVVRGLLEC